jgi:NAD(P)-dependent dehydrogenase (short-subunit alcohol dehydrogenase family)
MTSWLCHFDAQHAVDLLVANAGTSDGPHPDSPSEGVEGITRQVGVNLIGAVNTVEPLLPAMCARRRGRLAVVSSIAAYRGLPYSPGYCASKAGLRAYAEALRPRLERHGVGMTVICPGFFDSPMTDRFKGPTPLLLSSERAALIVKRGIDRGRRRIAFPRPLVLGLQFCDFAPAFIGDAIMRRYRFRIHSPQ